MSKKSVDTMTDTALVDSKAIRGSTVNRIIDILEAVAMAERPLTPTDLAAELDIPKASLHRLCAALEQHGFLQTRMNQRGLQPGLRFRKVALGVLASAPFQAQRQAILLNLSQEIGETCNIAVPDGAEMIYFDRVETHWPVRIQLQIGSRVPVYATASGKMFLSTLPPRKRERIVQNTKLKPCTDNTIMDEQALLEELELTANRGYATDNEEFIEGMVALAVPIVDDTNRLYATLSFNAPCMRVPFDQVTDHLPAIRLASEQLSALLDE